MLSNYILYTQCHHRPMGEYDPKELTHLCP